MAGAHLGRRRASSKAAAEPWPSLYKQPSAPGGPAGPGPAPQQLESALAALRQARLQRVGATGPSGGGGGAWGQQLGPPAGAGAPGAAEKGAQLAAAYAPTAGNKVRACAA
ncbi:hypothetical protein MNEG_7954 [Monoraphidium neglectum]|uniref:Uncharacterized protein n=1 Tax=Monoraphidium neglectum TaxID=145388 RepID=A0A0D2M9L5_9CHLO|nr:hypothetical protein MNEG_7954 [Monoraphidium neglectum]KIZ00005.1 hypothetical protein MNEG_7954 [Monoraphidium neglectum]|eukprot:XP_013899024.1 hypothetical protein MNEG_7954 [Monoraphidium neglectum]